MKRIASSRATRVARCSSIEALESRIAPATFTVTNTSSANIAGSFVNALNLANTTPNVGGPDLVVFNIPGAGPFVIAPTSSYTLLDPVIIDGYTQPGASPNTLAVGDNAVLNVVLNGSSAGTAIGLVATASASGSTVRGLVIQGYGTAGVQFQGRDNMLEGCFIGTDATGAIASANSTGVEATGADNLIGGTSPAARNIISGNDVGVRLSNNPGENRVQGNYIGTTKTGMTALPNTNGGITVVNTSLADNVIGGAEPGAGNLISGNGGPGININTAGGSRGF